MYFIPRNNGLYSYLVTIPQQLWYLLTLGVLFVLTLVWWKGCYDPVIHKEQAIRSERRITLHQQEAFTRIKTVTNVLERDVKILEDASETLLNSAYSQQIAVNTLITKALDAGLLLDSYVIRDSQTRTWYTVHDVEMSFSGAYENIMQFFHIVQLRQYLVQIKDFSIQKNDSMLQLKCTAMIMEFHRDDV